MKDVTVRASSMPTVQDCAARWHAENVLGLKRPSGGAAHLGTSLHHATGRFDQARVEESPIETGDAVDLFVDRMKKPTEDDGEVVWDSSMPQKKAIDAGALLMVDYCNRVSPAYTFAKVEVKCEPFTVRMPDEGVNITMTGQADRVRMVATNASPVGESWWMDDDEPGAPAVAYGIGDLKSGKRVVSSDGRVAVDKHIAQLGTYELLEMLTNRTLGIQMTLPAEVIALPTSGSQTKVVTETVHAPSRILLGEGKRKGLLHAIAVMAKNDLWPGNPRSQLCGARYCPIYEKCWWRGHQDSNHEGERR